MHAELPTTGHILTLACISSDALTCAGHMHACMQATSTRDLFMSNPVFREQDPEAPCVLHESGRAYFCMAYWLPMPSGERSLWLLVDWLTVVGWLIVVDGG